MLGQYQVIERIAVGGMAEIYLGVSRGEEGFARNVVIKKVRPRLSGDARFVEMLIREAKITASLNHPNIVQILDLGQNENGEHFIVMEYVEGHDLRSVVDESLARGVKIGIDRATYIAAEVCAGLHHAHRQTDEQGQPLHLIHRDVSPSNILISYAGEVKLTDFGIARYGRDVSAVGSLKGKLAYMSPEQARAHPVDLRSDIFSIAAILFEMVLGRRVFPGETDLEMLQIVRSGSIPLPSAIDPTLPLELEHVLLRALAPDPDRRFQSAEALQTALREFYFRHAEHQVGARELGELVQELFPARRRPEPAAAPARFTINTLAGALPREVRFVESETSVSIPSPALLNRLREEKAAASHVGPERRAERPLGSAATDAEPTSVVVMDEMLEPVPSRRHRPPPVPRDQESGADPTGRRELVRVLTAIPSLEVELEELPAGAPPPPDPPRRARPSAEPPDPPTRVALRSVAEKNARWPEPTAIRDLPRSTSSVELPAPAGARPSRPTRWLSWLVIAGLGMVLGMAFAVYLMWRRPGSHERSGPGTGSGLGSRSGTRPSSGLGSRSGSGSGSGSAAGGLRPRMRPDARPAAAAIADLGASGPDLRPAPTADGPRPRDARAAVAKVAARPAGRVILKSEPWAYIIVNGRRTGLTTSARPFSLPAGTHRIELHNPALGLRRSLVLKVRPGELVKSFVRLDE